MKKSFLALAVLGAFAGAAQAQSNVTLYGIVDVGLVRESGALIPGVRSGVTKITSGVESGSRIGFKGTEDLGSGLKGKFQVESGLCTDTGGFCTGGGVFMGRLAYVGLEGGFGSVTAGRQYTPYFSVISTADPFGTGLAGNVSNLAYNGDVRASNTIAYSTPATMGGFYVQLFGGLGEQGGSSSAGRTLGAATGYANGPLWVALAHHNAKTVGVPAGVPPFGSNKATSIGGTYDFNVVKLHAYYAARKVTTAEGVTSLDNNDWMVGLSVPAGPGSLMTSYTSKNDKLTANSDAHQVAVGYDYNLSKRTNLYTSFARISNKNGAIYTVGNATEAGSGTRAVNIGVRHKF